MMSAKKETKKGCVLVTGAAGFIGFHFAKRLLAEGFRVIGIDSINDYYDVNLKAGRVREYGFSELKTNIITQTFSNVGYSPDDEPELILYRASLEDREAIEEIFNQEQPDMVVHLAAQAGVRYSLENPHAYIDSNIVGFINILENCRHHRIQHLLYASSSSVYGANKIMPFSEHHNVDHPVSLYAATKKSNELMAHSYAHLYKLPVTGLRFFTVYGPWGRPDMAYFKFTEKIMNGELIDVYNHGNMRRDFTYIDDIVEGVYRVMLKIPEGNGDLQGTVPNPASSSAPYRVFNIGNNKPVELLYFIEVLEKHLGKKAEKRFMPFQKGDVKETYADIDALKAYVGFKPETPIEIGIQRFVAWYLDYTG
jgi:UDP-glucuronate 4-epimerase